MSNELFRRMPANILTGLSAKQLRRAATLRERIDGLEKQRCQTGRQTKT
jgi:hypothetical protein